MVVQMFRNSGKIVGSTFVGCLAVCGLATNANADMVRIIAKPMCKDVGHVLIAFYDENEHLVGTKAMWKGGVKTNTDEDKKIARGKDGGCFGIRTRTAYVTRTRREWLQNQVASPGGTGCQSYVYIGSPILRGKCSCVNFATRVWRQATADREQWQFQATPTSVANSIYSANGQNLYGIFDSGKTWN